MSMARPEGDSQPAGHVAVILCVLRVDLEHFALVFNVVVDVALAIGGGELGLAGHIDGGDDFARCGVDDRDVLAAAVEGPHGFGGGFVDDGVGIGAGGDGGDGGEVGAIEDHDRVASAIGDVADLAIGIERDAVGAVQAADGAEEFAAGGVDRVHMIAARDVDAMGGGVDEQVVPSAAVGELPLIENLIGTLRLRRKAWWQGR